MLYRSFLSIILMCATIAGAPAQTDKNTVDQEDSIVRINTNLVQLDVVVTDKKGRIVTDLTPADFEISQDGRSQKITNFSYIKLQPENSAQPALIRPAEQSSNVPALPPARLRAEQVRRTVALVVDDLGLGFEDLNDVRKALKNFVDEKIQPGDLVAIIRTRGNRGTLQQFTNDKRQLYAAIEQVRPTIMTRGSATLEDLFFSPFSEIEMFRNEYLTTGTLSALNIIVRGMSELPGRKSVVLISNGFFQFNNRKPVLDRLIEESARNSVVFYTIDARRLEPGVIKAEDDIGGVNRPSGEAVAAARRFSYDATQESLKYLANQTGGLFKPGINDGIKTVLDDQQGFYLIGYDPDEQTFDPTGRKNLHKLRVKVKRPGLTVRSRTGFYGITDAEYRKNRLERTSVLRDAVLSPFAATQLDLRLTALYSQDEREGAILRSLLHIDAGDLKFTTEGGAHKAVFDIVTVLFGDNGAVIDQISRTHTINVNDESYQRVAREGFVCILNFPVQKAGAYQLRAAVRDTATGHLGAASQFVAVPEISKGRLAMSDIYVTGGSEPATIQTVADSDKANDGTGATVLMPAVRRFKQGTTLEYLYHVYNGHANVKTQVRLFRDGQQVFAGKESALDANGNSKKLIGRGRILLGMELPAGEYLLQVIAYEGDKKKGGTARTIDFEIVE